MTGREGYNGFIDTELAAPDALSPVHVGKVREMYDVGGHYYLMVASDRISVFDVVLDKEVPGKGKVLTAMTEFWLTEVLSDIPNHLINTDMTGGIPTSLTAIEDLEGRGMLVQKYEVLPVECIVRGYLTGSGWKDYQASGTIKGLSLPGGLSDGSRLPEPIFTPSTKAELGDHDENISFEQMSEYLAGRGYDPALAEQARDLSLEIYNRGNDYASARDIILADTKFEFGVNDDGGLVLIDEVLTPDSSRFWDLREWEKGRIVQFDKQPVRDYFESQYPDWDKQPPAPPLPDFVVEETADRYKQILRLLTQT